MFGRFSSFFHHAVDALAPNQSIQQEFVAHWKAITHYFIENKDHKVAIENTSLPVHLEKMLVTLLEEEKEHDGMSGPCMEYLLQHKILETLYTLARTDVPPGMKIQILLFFTKLLSKIRQPLLPHVSVHRAVCRMIRTCGEIKAAPSESEEIQFLCTVCAKLKADPYLVNFFIEKRNDNGVEPPKATEQASFPLVESLLTLLQSPDARVSLHACEGLMLCASLAETASAHGIIYHSTFCEELIAQLVSLYSKLPKEMDPVDIDSVDAKWGLDIMSSIEDHQNFTGKRQLISFLSWLDYIDQLVHVAHHQVAAVFSHRLRKQFLEEYLQPAILQQSETSATTATAHLSRCLRLVTSKHLVREFAEFILGTEKGVEKSEGSLHKFRSRLIERCDHLSDEMSLTTLKLFELLLMKGSEHVVYNLMLRNLLGRSYASIESIDSGHHSPTSATEEYQGQKNSHSGVPCPNSAAASEEGPDSSKDASTTNSTPGVVADSELAESGGCAAPKSAENFETLESNVGANVQSITSSLNDAGEQVAGQTKQDQCATRDSSDMRSARGDSESKKVRTDSESELLEILNVGDGDAKEEVSTETSNNQSAVEENYEDDADLSPPGSPKNAASVHKIVNSFLNMLPEDAKSLYQMADSGYDTYLRDAHRQFTEVCGIWESVKWPSEPVVDPAYRVEPFYEGAFLRMILNRMSKLLHQSYDMNLQVTSLVSRLAYIPHPNLNEFLLDTQLSTKDDVRSLPSVLRKVVGEVQIKTQKTENFQKHLVAVRKQLMGVGTNFRRSKVPQDGGIDDSNMLEGVIVLEEFCKELAAIAFVKCHAIGIQQAQ